MISLAETYPQVISAGCHDVLCNQCAVETHSTGNRQDGALGQLPDMI